METFNKKEDKESQMPKIFEYLIGEDIYNQSVEVNINLDDLFSEKEKESIEGWNEQYIGEADFGNDLDIPGAELDDDLEEIGEEDEENNYYSIGGDNHNNLEENTSSIEIIEYHEE